jgi:hypothetical protein
MRPLQLEAALGDVAIDDSRAELRELHVTSNNFAHSLDEPPVFGKKSNTVTGI